MFPCFWCHVLSVLGNGARFWWGLITFKYTSTHTSCYATARCSCTCTHTSCYATARCSCTCTHTSCNVGVGWGGVGGLITFKYTSAHTSCYATARCSCTCTHTSCNVGVGWGGGADNVQVHFYTYVLLRYCTLQHKFHSLHWWVSRLAKSCEDFVQHETIQCPLSCT